MAKSLVQMGAAETNVNIVEFADDLQRIYESLDRLDPDIVVSETGDGNSIAATLAVDQQVVSQLLVDVVQVGEKMESSSLENSGCSSSRFFILIGMSDYLRQRSRSCQTSA